MKKKTKIILCSILGAVLLAGIGLTVARVSENADMNITGTMVAGSGEYDWVKYDVHIVSSSDVHQEKYYTNCNGDYLTGLYFHTVFGAHRIEYDTDFNIFDDFQAVFVICDNDGKYTITTPVETTHSPVGGDWIDIDDTHAYGSGSHYISEIWVRTVD